jgi:hypothetical protein
MVSPFPGDIHTAFAQAALERFRITGAPGTLCLFVYLLYIEIIPQVIAYPVVPLLENFVF